MVNVKVSQISSRVQTGLPGRWSGVYANPVGNYQNPQRGTARQVNPKLNGTPWSVSYAVNRQGPPASKSKKAKKG